MNNLFWYMVERKNYLILANNIGVFERPGSYFNHMANFWDFVFISFFVVLKTIVIFRNFVYRLVFRNFISEISNSRILCTYIY